MMPPDSEPSEESVDSPAKSSSAVSNQLICISRARGLSVPGRRANGSVGVGGGTGGAIRGFARKLDELEGGDGGGDGGTAPD